MKFIDSLFAIITCMICCFLIISQEPPFQDMLDQYDGNCNMVLDSTEVPNKLWFKIGSRDWNGSKSVDRKEYEGIIGMLRPE